MKGRNIIVIILAVVMIMSVAGCKNQIRIRKRKKEEAMIKHLNEKYRDYEEVSYGLDITRRWI